MARRFKTESYDMGDLCVETSVRFAPPCPGAPFPIRGSAPSFSGDRSLLSSGRSSTNVARQRKRSRISLLLFVISLNLASSSLPESVAHPQLVVSVRVCAPRFGAAALDRTARGLRFGPTKRSATWLQQFEGHLHHPLLPVGPCEDRFDGRRGGDRRVCECIEDYRHGEVHR